MRVLSFTELRGGLVLDFFSAWALWGGVLTGLVCLRELDLKRLIAYRSVSHISLVIAGILRLSRAGWAGACVIMVAHGLASSGLFFIGNRIYVKYGSRRLLVCRGLLGLAPGIAL